MIEALISSKTRIKLLLKFFLNSSNRAYLRGLEEEFGESTNAIRQSSKLAQCNMWQHIISQDILANLLSKIGGGKGKTACHKRFALRQKSEIIVVEHCYPILRQLDWLC